MTMVFAKKRYHESRSYARSSKSIGRLRIKPSLGFPAAGCWIQSLMTVDCDVDLFQFEQMPSYRRTKYMSWLPDPHAVAYDALLHPWRDLKGYAFPVLSHCSLSQKDAIREGDVTNNNTCIDNTTLVRESPGNVIWGPSSSPIHPQILLAPNNQIHPLHTTTCCRLGYFRQNSRSYSLSEDTEKLLFSSWSKGKNSSYDSAWNK
jgi:hypothetical protein